MKRYFWLFGSFFFLFLPVKSKGQEAMPGGWSIAISSGFHYSVSSSMHGDITQYEATLANGTTSAQYPFGAYRAYGVGFGAQLEYRIQGSPLSFYGGGYGTSFNAGNGFRNSSGGRFTMTIISTVAGIEYTSGQIYQIWNFYGRVGLVPSIIASSNRTSQNRFSDSLRLNTADSRLGMEVEIGERYHFPRWPIGIEVSINYTNVNLFGKSYSTPVSPGAFFSTGSINDGKNPSDANDNTRTIDYLSMRVGVRFYF